MERDISKQKKEAYKQLFGSESIISRPDSSISWEFFKEKYYNKENLLKNAIKELKKSTSGMSDITYSGFKALVPSVKKVEYLIEEVSDLAS